MRNQTTIILAASILLLLPGLGVAQERNERMVLSASFGGCYWAEEENGWGWSASIGLFPIPRLGIVGDLGSYGSLGDSRMAGLRAIFPRAKTTAFVQVLFGSAPLDDFAFQPGLGLDIHVRSIVALRIGGDLKLAGDGGGFFPGVRAYTGLAINPCVRRGAEP